MQLAAYVKTQLQAGYSIDQLRAFLLQQGYNSYHVEQAISTATQSSSIHTPYPPTQEAYRRVNDVDDHHDLIAAHRKKKLIFIIIALVAFVALASTLLLVLLGEGDTSVEQQTPRSIQTAPASQTVPSSSSFQEEQQNRNTNTPSVDRTGQNSEAQRSNSVVEQREEIRTTSQEPVVVSQINLGGARTSQIGLSELDDALEARSEDDGYQLCLELGQERLADTCFQRLAQLWQESSYCDPISSVNIRDGCYTVFALRPGLGNDDVCDKIVNQYRQLNCRSLGRSQTSDPYELLSRALEQIEDLNENLTLDRPTAATDPSSRTDGGPSLQTVSVTQ